MEYSSFKIEITFGRGANTNILGWKVLKHPVALLWVKLLDENLLSNRPLKSRFIGFTKGKRNPRFVGDLLNECIEIINQDGRYHIDERFDQGIDQNLFNAIHHHFSTLIGDESFKSKYWLDSCEEVQSAVCGLNDYVHELESWQRAIECEAGNPRKRVSYITSEFFEAPSFVIKEEWNQYFSLNGEFGDLCLHYDQIGKTWMEVLIDKDESIDKEDIRPLDLLTGSFNINFFETIDMDLKEAMNEHARKLGVNLEDASLRLGQCCVAKLVIDDGAEKCDLVDEVGSFSDISIIRLLKGEKVLREKVIPQSKERYFIS